MTLHERLEAAKAERRRRAGLPPEPPEDTPRKPPSGRTEPEIDLTGRAPVVDLRAELLRRNATPRFTEALPVSAEPTCPNCGCDGRLDMEDVVGGVDHFSCENCGLLYQVAR